jgi:protease PrsW
MLVNDLVALLPVLLFLAGLVAMDSFKLARPRTITAALAAGLLAALASDVVFGLLAPTLPISSSSFSRYVAPLVEESAKAVFVIYVVARRRIGFPVDAGQIGFAVGAGFAVTENAQYLRTMVDAPVVLWLVRGLGTAVMHGATTAIFAMLSKMSSDQHPHRTAAPFLPGWAAAVALHSLFNHLPLPPVAMTLVIVAVLPPLVLVVYQRSERATHEWVGAGLDLDLELLQLVGSEDFTHTRMGEYLQQLRNRFPGPVVADMLCLLRVELELAVQAKAMLLAREAGLVVPVHQDAASALAERSYLRRSIGRTGLLALKPLNVTTHRDDWHEHLLAPRRVGRLRGWINRSRAHRVDATRH